MVRTGSPRCHIGSLASSMSRLCVSTCRTFSTLHHIHHLIANLNSKQKPVLTRTDREGILTAPSRGKGSCVREGRNGQRQLKCLLSSSSYPGDCSLAGHRRRGVALATRCTHAACGAAASSSAACLRRGRG
jgi:hypothetical protein